MKFIGFINKHDDYFFAKDLQKYYLAGNEENTQRNEVIEYLKKGVLCGAIMSIAEDTDTREWVQSQHILMVSDIGRSTL